MHSIKDIQENIKRYYIRAGLILTEGGHKGDLSAAKRAEECFREGLVKLKKLRLSRNDRRNLRLLRNAYENGIKFTKELQRGRNQRAMELSKLSAQFAYRYEKALNARDGK